MEKKKEKQSGIYQIQNQINGDFYIGSSKDLNRRQKDHFSLLKRNKNKSLLLQRAVNKYGIDNFKFIILEECSIDQLFILEQKYVDELNPKYNICKLNVSVPIGLEHTPYKNPEKLIELAKQRLIDNPDFGWKSKKIVKLSEHKEILKEYNSLKEYAEEHQCSISNVSKAIKKKQRCKGYYVEYLESYINV